MSVQLVSPPVYRVDCDRAQCGRTFRPTGDHASTPEAARKRAQYNGWDLDGLDLCSTHARPPVRRGQTVIAIREDVSEWRTNAWTSSYRCRGHQCRAKAVVELKRKHGNGYRWWTYCAEHAYGRWVEGGRVWRWRVTQLGAVA